jgi:hypothetical protein
LVSIIITVLLRFDWHPPYRAPRAGVVLIVPIIAPDDGPP